MKTATRRRFLAAAVAMPAVPFARALQPGKT
jgi:hypothetical protein